MCDEEEAAALVIDNGSGMVKVSPTQNLTNLQLSMINTTHKIYIKYKFIQTVDITIHDIQKNFLKDITSSIQ